MESPDEQEEELSQEIKLRYEKASKCECGAWKIGADGYPCAWKDCFCENDLE